MPKTTSTGSQAKDDDKSISKKQKKHTIMSEIFKSILVSSFITFILFITAVGIFMYHRNIKYTIGLLEEQSKHLSTEIFHYFQDISSTIEILSYSSDLKEASQLKEKRSNLLETLTKFEFHKKEINNVLVAYNDNTLITNSKDIPVNYNFKEAEWYKKAINNNIKTITLELIPDQMGVNKERLIISKSFQDEEKTKGVIAVDCLLDSLYSILSPNFMFPSNCVFLANKTDKEIISKNDLTVENQLISENSDMFNSLTTSFTTTIDKTKYLVFSRELPEEDWFIISKIKYSDITNLIILRVLLVLIILILLTIFASKLLSNKLGKTFAKPILEVSAALQALAKGNKFVEPINIKSRNEIGAMAENFNTFLKTTSGLKSDITELKETKDKLSYSLSLLNASIESTDDAILIINIDGYTTKWNKRFLELWEITEDEIEFRKSSFLLPLLEDKIVDTEQFLKTIAQVSENPDMISFDIIEFNNGLIIERSSFPQKIAEKIVGRVWRYRDITRIKKSEILLQDSEVKHRVMFTQTIDAYCIMDNGVFTEVNEAALKLLRSSKDWLLGKTPLDLSPQYQPNGRLSAESVEENINLGFSQGRHSFNWLHKRSDGTEFPAEITLVKFTLKEKDLLLVIWRDVTKEREIAEKLKSSEQNFRLFFESLEDMIFISDRKGNIKYSNRATEKNLGYSLAELTAMNAVELYHNYQAKNTDSFMEKFIVGEVDKCSLPVKTKTGHIIPVETRTWIGRWNGEECLFGICKDISKEQEALLKFNKVFESNPNLIALASYPDRKFIDVNGSLCKALGYAKEDLIGKTADEVDMKMELAEPNISDLKLISCGNFTNIHLNVFNKDSKKIEGLLSGEVIETNGRKFFLTVMTDISELKRISRKLRESEQKYRLLFENMTTGFALHKMLYNDQGEPIDYRFLVVNAAFEQFTGLKADDISGKTVKEVLPNTEAYWIKTYGKVSQTGKPVNFEQYSAEFDKYFEVKAFSPEPNTFATIFSDVTERVKALKELEREKELAQAATKAKSEFLANMSHEIRTPLNGVIGFTDLLLSTDLTPSQKQFAANANVSGKALLGIISDILDFSKIEAGKMELDLINSSITQIMEQALDIIKFQAFKKGIDIILDIPVDFPEKAMIDPLRLKQMLLNLLNNAVKFTKNGEVELNVTFIPSDTKTGRFVFKIKDTGIGISKEASKILFNAFSQADGSITRKYGGTGLGLVISNYLAEKMGSQIDFVSEEGNGSEFYFALDTKYLESTNQRRDSFKGKKVLVADKNTTFMRVIKKRLEFWGLSTTLTSDLEAFKENVLSTNYDALLIDERIISKSDYQEANEIIANYKASRQKRSIVITYCPTEDFELTNFTKQFDLHHILTKPIIIDDLFDCLQNIFSDEIGSFNKVAMNQKFITELSLDKKVKVLIAEDVEMNMILIKTLIKKIVPNVEIFAAKNGMEAVHLFKEKNPDLILMDLQMPELDGLEATKVIKKLEQNQKVTRSVPIIALTAAAFTDDKEKCLKAGMVDFLTKPISIKELTKMLEKYLINN